MIMPQTRVRVADNTGARELMCIRVVAGGSKFEASVGDVIVASVKEATPGGSVNSGSRAFPPRRSGRCACINPMTYLARPGMAGSHPGSPGYGSRSTGDAELTATLKAGARVA